jgi:DnaJ-class molecular chaperone
MANPIIYLPCIKCGGSGSVDEETCEACEGSGNHTCDKRGCRERAVGFDDNGRALCEDCLSEWTMEDQT